MAFITDEQIELIRDNIAWKTNARTAELFERLVAEHAALKASAERAGPLGAALWTEVNKVTKAEGDGPEAIAKYHRLYHVLTEYELNTLSYLKALPKNA